MSKFYCIPNYISTIFFYGNTFVILDTKHIFTNTQFTRPREWLATNRAYNGFFRIIIHTIISQLCNCSLCYTEVNFMVIEKCHKNCSDIKYARICQKFKRVRKNATNWNSQNYIQYFGVMKFCYTWSGQDIGASTGLHL